MIAIRNSVLAWVTYWAALGVALVVLSALYVSEEPVLGYLGIVGGVLLLVTAVRLLSDLRARPAETFARLDAGRRGGRRPGRITVLVSFLCVIVFTVGVVQHAFYEEWLRMGFALLGLAFFGLPLWLGFWRHVRRTRNPK